MKKTDRIIQRLPQFYLAWDKSSLLYKFLDAISRALHEEQLDMFSVMRSHWVNTAHGESLDYLAGIHDLKRLDKESDSEFRRRIKMYRSDYIGGGTKQSILNQISDYLKLDRSRDRKIDRHVKLIENPITDLSKTFTVRHGDTWEISSMSIDDHNPASVIFSLMEGDESNTQTLQPTITDKENKLLVQFKGAIRPGQSLTIESDFKAVLDSVDVSDQLHVTKDRLLLFRKGSSWTYSDSVSPRVGRFDESIFDEHVFDIRPPNLVIEFRWKAKLLSTIEVIVSSNSLKQIGGSKEDLDHIVNRTKALGVDAFVTIEDK